MEMMRRVYFVGFQTKDGKKSGNTTLERVNEHNAESYMKMIPEIAKGIEELCELGIGSVIINSLTILFEEKVIDNSSQQDI